MTIKPADLRRLRAMLDKLERDETYFQSQHGDPVPGSVRSSLRLDADALRRVIEGAKGE